jgi:hypothetical protein
MIIFFNSFLLDDVGALVTLSNSVKVNGNVLQN